VPTRTIPERPPGPIADLSQEITGTNAPFIGASSPAGLADAGYVEHEYVAAGTATSYVSDGPFPADGTSRFTPDGAAAYRTRVLVRSPADPAAFSGTVVVEWLNVSGGVDANPDYASLQEELLRNGDAWVGVSAQRIGIEGGPVLVTAPGGEGIAGVGLKVIDPVRYSSLIHPGDGYSFDIFTQVARAVEAGSPALGDMQPDVVIAAGESQSAIALTTYYNGVQPLAKTFDGFFIHSRGSAGLPLVGPGQYADLAGSLTNTKVTFRTDVAAPVMDIQSEGDVVGLLDSAVVRQPDSDTFRLWEVAGTSHADAHLLGANAARLDCGVPINDGPLHIVAKAALHSLDDWIRTGAPPPKAERIVLTTDAKPAVARSADGIALGGIRTPPVDVPTVALSGSPGPSTSVLCLLLGSTNPLAPERLVAMYPTAADYTTQYAASVDQTIASGFALESDRRALLDYERQPARTN
jgi:hypothetical protein